MSTMREQYGSVAFEGDRDNPILQQENSVSNA